MPSNTKFNPSNIDKFDKAALNFSAIGVAGSANSGTSTTIDYKLTDDMLLTGSQVLTNGTAFGDSLSFQIIDIDGILTPAGTVLGQFVTNWQLRTDSQEQIKIEINYPAKIYSGLYLRLIYNSTGNSDVLVSINYFLHKILI